MRYAAVPFAVAFCLSAFASGPGQPLDCSDWVFDEPGHSCAWQSDCAGTGPDGGCYLGDDLVQLDAASGRLQVRRTVAIGMCGRNPLYRLEVVRDSTTRTIVAHLDERCVDANHDRIDGSLWNGSGNANGEILFDPWKGELLVAFESFSIADSGASYPTKFARYGLGGFATTFDVLQTFTSQVGFRVPYMPEGMPGADHFDTYWGPLTKPLDFTQAHPLVCDYPATPPHVGDYVTVADTVPTPAPGQAVYYLTSTTYQGQTRDGRKTTAGHLTGRDPALLPACTP